MKTRGKRALAYRRHCSAGCERVQALTGEKRAKMLGKSDRERKLHDTSTTELAGKQSGGSFSRVLKSFLFIEKKRRDSKSLVEAFKVS